MRMNNRRTRRIPVAIITLALLVCLMTSAAPSVSGQDRPTARDVRRDRLWSQQWPRYAAKFQKLGDAYYYFPHFSEEATNSLGLSEREIRDDVTVEWIPNPNKLINKVVSRKVSSPPEDIAVALRVLPAYRAGEYGYIQSCNIVESRGEGEAVVNEIRLLDRRELERQRRDTVDLVKRELGALPRLRTDPEDVLRFMFRHRSKALELEEAIAADGRPLLLRGFTREHTREHRLSRMPSEGSTWDGPIHIAILGEEDGRMVAVPPTMLKPVETEEEFLDVLASRNITREMFLDQFEELMRNRIAMAQIEKRMSMFVAALGDNAMEGIDLRESFEDVDKAAGAGPR